LVQSKTHTKQSQAELSLKDGSKSDPNFTVENEVLGG
jgi:hypothetical protein